MTSTLPPLDYESWRLAKNTLHLWCQIIGKTKLSLTPRRNHWWNVTLYVSPRGLTTGRLPASSGNLEVEIDLVDHRLRARTTEGDASFSLSDGLTVATFHERFLALLDGLGVKAEMRPQPFGVPMTTPFPEDVENRSYDADAAGRFLHALQWNADVFEEFAGWFCGKTSPVQLFWHSFDLAVTRFSGRRAPAMPGADPVTEEAYSHEVVSFGFWAGDDTTRFPAYYSYTAPEPPGLREQPIRPAPAAAWVERGVALWPSCPTTTSALPTTPTPSCSSSCSPPTRPAPAWPAGTSMTPAPTGARSSPREETTVADDCTHLDQAEDVTPSSEGCEDCIPIGARWVHLRVCMSCGHVGCCDSSPNRHATAHFHSSDHPLIQSYEPGEDWWWCYVDGTAMAVDGPSYSHP